MQSVPSFHLFKQLFPLCVILLLISINIYKVNAKDKDKNKKDDGDCGIFMKILTFGGCSKSKSKPAPEATVQLKDKEVSPTPPKEKEKEVQKAPSFNPADGVTPKFSLVGMKPVDSIDPVEGQEKKNPWTEGYVTPEVPNNKPLTTEEALVKDGKL